MISNILINQIQLFIIIVSFFLGNDLNREYGHSILLIHYIFIILIFFPRTKDKTALLFSPSFLTVTYITLSLILGSWVFSKGYVISSIYLQEYDKWGNIHYIYPFFMVCNLTAMYSIRFMKEKYTYKQDTTNNYKIFLMFSVFILLITLLFRNQVMILFGGYIGQIQTFLFLLIAYILNVKNIKYRFIFYFIIIIYFSVISPFGKRAAAQFFISLSFIEVIRFYNIKYNFKKLVVSIVITALFFLSIIYMSILRGYGGFLITNHFQPFTYIQEYVSNENFGKYIAENLELNTTFFHSIQSINYVLNDFNNLTFGSTIIKGLFIVTPRSIFEKKPDSMIKKYTSKFDKYFYARGGSYPICIYSESFWNFHYLGIFFIFILFYISNKIYYKMVESFRSFYGLKFLGVFYMYHYFLVYIRGSGLDIYLIYMIIGFAMNAVFKFFNASLSVSKTKKYSETVNCI
jgi:hypothetical protein